MIVDKINAYLTAEGRTIDDAILKEVAQISVYTFIRQFGEAREADGALRLSAIGQCSRKNAYKLHGFDINGKEIDSRSKMVFFQGDMAELAIIQLAKIAGCNITSCGMSQDAVQLQGIPGHPDGILHNGKKYLVEAKSMSSYGFEKFERGEIDDSYIYQINAYMEALGVDECIFVGLNKDAGVLHEMIIKKDTNIVRDISARIAIVQDSTKNNLPAPAYQADAKGFLPWQCTYCGYWKTCKPKAEKVLVNRSYKLKEKI